jgi:predicted small integral membrane protein
MYWTWPSAIFFLVIILTIIGLNLWDTFFPDIKRKGFLPITTSRGDRVFIAIISTIGICIAWLGVAGNSLFIGAIILSIIWNIVIIQWG